MNAVPFEPDYYATAFQTIASLASRCLDERGTDAHDIIFGIQKMSEGLARELATGSGCAMNPLCETDNAERLSDGG